MRTTGSIVTLVLAVSLGCTPLFAQTASNPSEIEQLKSLVSAQQKALEQQQSEIRKLQSSLAEQQQLLIGVMQNSPNGARLMPAVDRTTDLRAADYNPQAPQDNQAMPAAQEPTAAEQEVVEEELQRGPEIADVTPDTPALKLGPAKVRLIGFPAMTMLFRSTNSGGNVGTSFANIPFDNTVPGNTTEFRISPQSTRLAIRVDADLNTSKAAGYFEMDFGGSPNAGNIAVTSSSYTFRIRQAWFDYAKNKWQITGGQLFTLMTPVKKSILPWPGDVATTQVVDTNYVAGLVWGRYPQFRAVYHYSKGAAFGFSVENPEQQVGNNVVFPSALNSIVSTQYNTGSQELRVPNMTPDFVLKGSFDGKMGERALHFDAGTVMRVFRSYNGTSVSGKDYAFGWGRERQPHLRSGQGLPVGARWLRQRRRWPLHWRTGSRCNREGQRHYLADPLLLVGQRLRDRSQQGHRTVLLLQRFVRAEKRHRKQRRHLLRWLRISGSKHQRRPADRGSYRRILAGGLEARGPRFRAVGRAICLPVAVSLGGGHRPERRSRQHAVLPVALQPAVTAARRLRKCVGHSLYCEWPSFLAAPSPSCRFASGRAIHDC